MFKDKGFIIGILVTTVLIVGGVFYFTKDAGKPAPSATPISKDILIPANEIKTGGIVNGEYIAASDSAKLTLVEFGDYECPACEQYHPLVKKILTDYAGKITFVFRNYPLSQHKNAQISAQAAEATGLQNKYWQMHDKIFESSTEWNGSSNAKDIFIGYAEKLGLDVNKFKTDIDSSAIKDKIKADVTDGNLIRLSATPTYYLNGIKLESLPANYADLKSLFDTELAK